MECGDGWPRHGQRAAWALVSSSTTCWVRAASAVAVVRASGALRQPPQTGHERRLWPVRLQPYRAHVGGDTADGLSNHWPLAWNVFRRCK